MHMVLIEGMEVEEVGGGAQVAAISGIGHTSYSQSANIIVCFSKWGHGISCHFAFLWRVKARSLPPPPLALLVKAAISCKVYAASDILKYHSGFLLTDSSFAGTVGLLLAGTDALLTCCTAEGN